MRTNEELETQRGVIKALYPSNPSNPSKFLDDEMLDDVGQVLRDALATYENCVMMPDYAVRVAVALGSTIITHYQQKVAVLVYLNRHAASCAYDIADLLANVPKHDPLPDDLRALTTEIFASPEVRGNAVGFSFLLTADTEQACKEKMDILGQYILSRVSPGTRKIQNGPSELPFVIENVFVGPKDAVVSKSSMFGARRYAENAAENSGPDSEWDGGLRFAA